MLWNAAGVGVVKVEPRYPSRSGASTTRSAAVDETNTRHASRILSRSGDDSAEGVCTSHNNMRVLMNGAQRCVHEALVKEGRKWLKLHVLGRHLVIRRHSTMITEYARNIRIGTRLSSM